MNEDKTEIETLLFKIEYKTNDLTEEESNDRLIAITNLIGSFIEGIENVTLINKM